MKSYLYFGQLLLTVWIGFYLLHTYPIPNWAVIPMTVTVFVWVGWQAHVLIKKIVEDVL